MATKATKRTISKEDVIEFVSNMTVLELSELIEQFEEKFGVSATTPIAVSASTVPEKAEQVEEAEKTEFDVMLMGVGDKKIQVIKAVREELVDNVPSKVKEGVSKEDAENIKKQLEEAGATADIK